MDSTSEANQETGQVVYQDDYSDYDYEDHHGVQERQNLLSSDQQNEELIDAYPIQVTANTSGYVEKQRPMYSASNFVIRVRIPSGSVLSITEINGSCTLHELCTILQQRTEIPIASQQRK